MQKRHNSLYNYVALGCFSVLMYLSPCSHAHAEAVKQEKNFIIRHITDAHAWHFATINDLHIVLPLPIIIYSKDQGLEFFLSSRFLDDNHQRIAYRGYKLDEQEKIVAIDKERVFYDFSITKNVAAILINSCLLIGISLTMARQYKYRPKTVPHGFRSFFELFLYFVRDDIAKPMIGKKNYERFMPYLLTVFFFIWLNNLMGLLPGAANVTGNISVTLVLALFTFVLTNMNGKKHYWEHVFNPVGIPKWLLPIMIPVEFLGLFTKPFSLMIRLFANITAGHIILLSIISLVFIFQSVLVGVVAVPFGAFMFLLKLIVAFLQAYVFTLLSAIYFGAAVEHAHQGHEEEVDKSLI